MRAQFKGTAAALCLLLAVFSGPAVAADPVDALVEALAGIERLAGRFRQEQFDESGALLLESSGRFRLLRPGYFAWDIVSPDSQLVIADPRYVWHYDRDLQTVTRRPADSGGAMAPLQVLGGDTQALRDAFRIEEGAEGRFKLTPVSPDGGFESLTLQLADDQVVAMTVHDDLGQRIVIHFLDVDRDPPLTPADFSFEPPEDADVFYHDE